MQLSWLVRGLRTGVLTTKYPRGPEAMPSGFRGLPTLDATRCHAVDGCDACVRACLPAAITVTDHQNGRRGVRFTLNYGACIMCGLCVTACPHDAMVMQSDYELATRDRDDLVYSANLNGVGEAS